MAFPNIFDRGGKYFGNNIKPSSSYCEFGRRAKHGNAILCEKKGIVDPNSSCPKFVYSALKRDPVKQLNIPGNFDDEEDDDDSEDDD